MHSGASIVGAERFMKNESAWTESKYARNRKGEWKANNAVVPVTSRLITNRTAQAYGRLIVQHARGRLADIGCGEAPLYGMYRPFVDDVFCVDWEDSLHKALHVDAYVDLNAAFDIGEGAFDTIVATDVIEHLCEPGYFFSACARALKPGGKMLLGVPFMYWIHEAPHDYHRYTRYCLEYMVHKAGLKCISLEAYGGTPEVLSDILTKGAGAFRPMATVSYHLLNWLLAFGPVKRISARSCAVMPLGYTLVAEKSTENPDAEGNSR